MLDLSWRISEMHVIFATLQQLSSSRAPNVDSRFDLLLTSLHVDHEPLLSIVNATLFRLQTLFCHDIL